MHLAQLDHQRRVLLRGPGCDVFFHAIGEQGVEHGYLVGNGWAGARPEDVLGLLIPTLSLRDMAGSKRWLSAGLCEGHASQVALSRPLGQLVKPRNDAQSCRHEPGQPGLTMLSTARHQS